MPSIKVAIDAGHGSKTAGKRTPPLPKDVDINGDGRNILKQGTQYREHYANVGVADLLYRKLKLRGFDVLKVGWDDSNATDDSDASLSSRQKKIKKAKCDYSISIHFNAYGDGKTFNSVKGFSVYIHDKHFNDSRRLAEYALRELSKNTPQVNRGIHAANFAMCNCKTMNTKASILCELAFMTNLQEATEMMANRKFWEECADELAEALDLYCNSNNHEETDKTKYKLYHTVTPGETLTKIATRENMTVSKLVELNNLKDPNRLYVGQKLLLSEYTLYTVKKGDSLSAISQKLLKSTDYVNKIKELNQLKNDVIYVDQVLKIPVIG